MKKAVPHIAVSSHFAIVSTVFSDKGFVSPAGRHRCGDSGGTVVAMQERTGWKDERF
jgi:hypothetical protein